MRLLLTRILWTAYLALAGASTASAADMGDIEQGRILAERICSRCHAVGAEGDSIHADAPPFRELHQRYPVNDLEEALGEGIVTGHPDMPEISFGPDDAAALIDYMISIQEP